jgi:hypothetical protein
VAVGAGGKFDAGLAVPQAVPDEFHTPRKQLQAPVRVNWDIWGRFPYYGLSGGVLSDVRRVAAIRNGGVIVPKGFGESVTRMVCHARLFQPIFRVNLAGVYLGGLLASRACLRFTRRLPV